VPLQVTLTVASEAVAAAIDAGACPPTMAAVLAALSRGVQQGEAFVISLPREMAPQKSWPPAARGARPSLPAAHGSQDY
jgi:hypothetical protein